MFDFCYVHSNKIIYLIIALVGPSCLICDIDHYVSTIVQTSLGKSLVKATKLIPYKKYKAMQKPSVWTLK